MKELVKSELQRLMMRRRTVIILSLSVVAFLFLSFFNSIFGIGFYDPNITATLDALNFAPFILRDYHFYLVLILCPLLTVETFNRERYSGEYRLVMIRPYSKAQFYVAKMISLSVILGGVLVVLWVIGNVFAHVMLPTSSSTIFFNAEQIYSSLHARLFSFSFYFVEYVILIAVIAIISLVSLCVPNTVLSYLGSVFVVWMIGFSCSYFEFLVSSTRSIFDLLLGMGSGTHVILYLMVILGISFTSSYLVFRRNDYLS